jgi:phosphatidylethanolamine-binding protein (PEBP) family uncharacterized protein
MRTAQYLGIASATAFVLGLATTGVNAADPFTLQSETFQDGRMMPKKVAASTAIMPGNANCVGDNISPQLSWTNVPAGTKSFALLVTDPAPGAALA